VSVNDQVSPEIGRLEDLIRRQQELRDELSRGCAERSAPMVVADLRDVTREIGGIMPPAVVVG
jgi:hypothetical protein